MFVLCVIGVEKFPQTAVVANTFYLNKAMSKLGLQTDVKVECRALKN